MSRFAWIVVGLATIGVVAAIVVAVIGVGGSGSVPPTATAYPCPQATPELLAVQPVTSPTNELTQTISVSLGNGESISVETASGIFSAEATTPFTDIEIELLPATTHELTVSGVVAEIQQGDCTYGGYTLSTTVDRNGDPLVIVTE